MRGKISLHADLWVQVGELRQKRGHKKPQHEAGAVFVPRTGLEPARPKAQPWAGSPGSTLKRKKIIVTTPKSVTEISNIFFKTKT